MISPTSLGVRDKDNWGEGRYGVSRGNRMHKGTDYICNPGQDIVTPISGKIIREAKPYAGSHYSGVLIKGEHISIKMFYFTPYDGFKGRVVKKGEAIGTAQDISEKYDRMTPHIHLEIITIDPEIVTNYL
jgi:hypothetical protein